MKFMCIAIMLSSLTICVAEDAPKSDLCFTRVDLPDGNKWVLGEGGVGRPFMATLLLENRGKTPITIWDHQNSEGAQCPGIILTDAKGNPTILRPPPMPRAAGIPTVITIPPNQIVRIELELLRLIGERGLPPGRYKIEGFYENELKNSFDFIKAQVWTGKIKSEPMGIEIVAPTRAKRGFPCDMF